MITIDHAFIADYAAERGGSVGAMGIGIDTLIAAQLPTTHPHIFLNLQLRCAANYREPQPIALRLVDSSGGAILEQTGGLDFSNVPKNQEGTARMVFGFYLIPFTKADEFQFEIQIGDAVVKKIPLTVVHNAAASNGAPQSENQGDQPA